MEIAVCSVDASSPSSVKRRRKVGGVCGVCGDFAKTRHFGALACGACRLFFRRAVRGGSYANFTCKNGGNCSLRGNCRHCRFKKCREIGMDPTWVMDEAERAEWKTSRLIISNIAKPVITIERVTAAEQECIETLIRCYKDAVMTTPLTIAHTTKPAPPKNLFTASALFLSVLRAARFLSSLTEFLSLSQSDASVLYMSSIHQLVMLRAAFASDCHRRIWPSEHAVEGQVDTARMPIFAMDDMLSESILGRMARIMDKLHEMRVDEPCTMLLMLVVFFRPERNGLTNPEQVEQIQERMALILKKYIRWRYGVGAGVVYAKLLSVVVDLQETVDQLDERTFCMDENQVEIMQTVLGELTPYLSYSMKSISYPETDVSAETEPHVDFNEILSVLDNAFPPSEPSTGSNFDDETGLFELLENIDDLF